MERYVDYGFINWTHEKILNDAPQLLHVDKVLSTDPITDCLKQIPKLIYTYLESGGHGESQLHDDTMEVFRNTQVWVINKKTKTRRCGNNTRIKVPNGSAILFMN